MKIKLLPFDEAVTKADECNRYSFEYNTILGINMYKWYELSDKTYYANDISDKIFQITYKGNTFFIPKCCCEVIEE